MTTYGRLINKGKEIGKEENFRKVILRMHEMGYAIAEIAKVLEVDEDFARRIIEEASAKEK